MKKLKFLFLVSFLISGKTFSQDVQESYSLFPTVGINAWKYSYVNVGVRYSEMTLKAHNQTSYNLFLAAEISLSKNIYMNPKVGCFITYNHLAASLSIIYYTKSKDNVFSTRPEIGAEFKNLKLMYGYNLKSKTSVFNKFNSHLIEFTYSFRDRAFLSWKK